MGTQTAFIKDKQENFNFPVSLNKYLSIAGVAARRKCAEIIREGRVKVNGRIVCDPGHKVIESDDVCFDESPLFLEKPCYVMFYKPRGALCTAADVHAKSTIFDFVKIPGRRLFSAGRLDRDSEGLLILTNDGGYSLQLMHPRYETVKTYIVSTQRPLTKEDIASLQKGVSNSGEILKAEKIFPISHSGCEYKFLLKQGKKREIRRMVAQSMNKVITLKRIAIGNLFLDEKLKPGEWRFMTDEEIKSSLSPMRP